MWGLTFPLVKDAIERIPVMTFLGYRFTAAALLVAIVFRRPLPELGREGWRAGAVMGIFLTGGYVFQTLGLERTTASHAGFITGLWVILTPLFAALFFGQKVGRPVTIAAAVSAVGLYLLSGLGDEGDVFGDLLVLVCAVSFTFHIFATDSGVRRFDIGALLVVQLGFCGLFSLAVAAGQGELVVPRDSEVWVALFLTAIVASAIGFFVQTYAQQHASPSRTALILASEPAFAGLFSYWLKAESLSLAGWVGAGLIMAAIVGVELMPHLRPSARPLPEQ